MWPLTLEVVSLNKKTILNKDYKDILRALCDEKVKAIAECRAMGKPKCKCKCKLVLQ